MTPARTTGGSSHPPCALISLIWLLTISFLLASPFHCVAEEIVDATSTMARPNEDPSPSDTPKMGSGGIRWRNLSVSLKPKRRLPFVGGRTSDAKKRSQKKILVHPSSYHVENGQICGILGPSGAGKSTLLAALSSTTLKSSGLELTGSVWMDEKIRKTKETNDDAAGEAANERNAIAKAFLSTSDGEVAFLHQQDAFFSMLTPRETLDLAGYLQLSGCSSSERRQIVDQTLDLLGLAGVADRKIGERSMGGSEGGGLSGGERRRLSLATELITSPKVFFGDEPTTGLDSSQAEKVVNLIAKLAKERNIPAICSIHQPRTSIWKSLDSFILLAPGGKVCYMGGRKDATAYFADLGYECPHDMNPAEHYIDLVTIDTEDPLEAAKDIERIDGLAEAFTKEMKRQETSAMELWRPPKGKASFFGLDLGVGADCVGKVGKRNFFQRFFVLLQRAWRQNMRNYKLNILRLLGSVGQAILFSEMFTSVRHDKSITKSIADRCALLSFGVINMCMLSVMKTLDLFGREKPVVTRERMRNQYSNFEYLVSKAIAEIPIDALFGGAFAAVLKTRTGLRTSLSVLSWTFSLLTVAGASIGFAIGSVAPNAESSLALGVPIMVVLMAVGIINPSGVDLDDSPPAAIQWIKMASPIKWCIEALVLAEFRGMEFGDNRQQRWRALKDLPRMGGLALVRDGNQVIDALGLTNLTYEYVMQMLTSLAGISLLLSWCGLTWFGPAFIDPNASSEIEEDNKDNEIACKTSNTKSSQGIEDCGRKPKEPAKIAVVRGM